MYYPAIDGLRAIAVVAVVLYHIGEFLPAGFIGVDIFFVISGFVVTLAARTLPSSALRPFMAGFYARRMLRIAPALLVCVLGTMLVSALIVPEAGLSRGNAKTGIAALFGVSNLMLNHLANDYWAPTSEFNPFTHTWSLGVEEQFYLIFPLLYFAWAKGYRKQGMSALLALMLASIVLLIVWTRGGGNRQPSMHCPPASGSWAWALRSAWASTAGDRLSSAFLHR